MKEKVKKYLRPLFYTVKLLLKLNIIKTVYVNFRKLPFKQAVRLPIFIYWGVKITSLKGCINFNKSVRPGMLRVGFDIDGAPLSANRNIFLLRGTLSLNGYTIIGKGGVLNVQGILEMGNCTTIGSGCLVKVMSKVIIGNNTRVTPGCTIFDSNMHYVKNIKTGVINRIQQPIIIGENCWINSGSILTKGTVLPDYSIVARNSFLNKDYSQYGSNLFIAGSPAKVLNNTVQRIFSRKEELKLHKEFNENKADEIIKEPGIFEDPDKDIESFFREIK